MRLLSNLPPAAVLLLISAHPVLAGKPAVPVPLANPADWVTDDDYPKSALEKNHEGTTGFSLTIGTDGRVHDCKVTVGSGWEVLDEATCRLVSERARFSPGLDRRGRAVGGTYANRVRWVIPKSERLPADGILVQTSVVALNGDLSDCRVEVAEGDATREFKVGPMPGCKLKSLSHGYVDADGKPVAKMLRYTTRIEVLDLPPGYSPPVPPPPAVAPK